MGAMMIKSLSLASLICAAGWLVVSAPSQASIVQGTLLYANSGPPDYRGPATIDRVTFDVTAGTTLNFDILAWELKTSGLMNVGVDLNGDGEFTVFDSQIRLFDSA